jgi:hypothetical protein
MSSPKSEGLEGELSSILSDHFDQHLNPHETIYKIWLALNVVSSSSPDNNKSARNIEAAQTSKLN